MDEQTEGRCPTCGCSIGDDACEKDEVLYCCEGCASNDMCGCGCCDEEEEEYK